MKGIYLASRKHRISGYQIDYNDIEEYEGIDLRCDMMQIDINKYDFVIATPPCNYYSRANYRRETSEIAQKTKHLLPDILKKLENYNKPFIVENVCNKTLLPKSKFYEFEFNQHHYYTNIFMFQIDKSFKIKQNKQNVGREKRDNNPSVDIVIKEFLRIIHNENTNN